MPGVQTILLTAGALAVLVLAVQLTSTDVANVHGTKAAPSRGERVTTVVSPPPQKAENGATLEYGFCCCSAQDVDENTQELLSSLNDITAHPYFRYFKVNSEKDCPFWAVSLLCTSEDDACSVGKCTEESIPLALRSKEDMSNVHTPDSHIFQSVPHPKNVDEWGIWGSAEDGAEYVDLVANPEGNTGFSGPMAIRVWQAIYSENCLSTGEDKCQEVDVLKTLLSGLHMSINMHVCTNFRKDPELQSPQHTAGIYNNPNISFYPNCDMYEKRVAPNAQFIDNLYILYEFVLRALTKAKGQFVDELDTFNSGENGVETPEDAALKKSIVELFSSKLLCVKTFDETKFLESPKGRALIPEMNRMMTNVTLLMDCVPCEKCRIWGKLETKGMATALKVNMDLNPTSPTLDRSEKVTLINLARQLAFSVRNVKRLHEHCASIPDDVAVERATHG